MTNNSKAITELNSNISFGTTIKQTYTFPTSSADTSNPRGCEIKENGMACIEYSFLGTAYSQFSLVVNGTAIARYSSGSSNLGGLSTVIIPVKKGDVISVSFYENYAMATISMRLF